MVELSLSKNVTINDKKKCTINYMLLSNGDAFDLECFIGEKNPKEEMHYCYVKKFTKDEEFAQQFIQKLADGEVFPIHVQDILEDFCFC